MSVHPAIVVVFAVILVGGLYMRIRFMRTAHDVMFGPNLHDRIHAIFDPFEGQRVSQATLEQLEVAASRAFEDILTGVGLLPGDWKLKVHVDDVLGPIPRLHGPDGQVLEVATFEQRVRTREIELPSA